MDKIKKFLGRNKAGLVIRTFAQRAEDVENRLQLLQQLLAAAKGILVNGKPVFSRVDVMVFDNPAYAERDSADLYSRLALLAGGGIFIHRVTTGDLFVGCLNKGIRLQVTHGIHYTFIWSPDVHAQMRPENLVPMFEQLSEGAFVVGLALAELGRRVKDGFYANTAAGYCNAALLDVGMFDHICAKPADDREGVYVKGDGGRYYPRAGVEEVIPLARMYEQAKAPVLAIVEPFDPAARYAESTIPEIRDRNEAKFASKALRQEMVLLDAGYTSAFLKGCVRDFATR